MGKAISLFSDYSQKENRTTNYCLLALKMIYEESPKFFTEILSGLMGYDLSDDIGVKFRQQEKKTQSIPDGLILQKAFTIYIETKNFDWFYDEQLKNHLNGLKEEAGLKILIALGNFEKDTINRFSTIENLCKSEFKENKIIFSAISFEDFISAIELPTLPPHILEAIKDLRAYLDEGGFLPSWKNWLDVVNCASFPEDVIRHQTYLCPAEGGSYSHSRCKYFGMYKNKRVEKIAEIRAVIDIKADGKAELLWKNTNEKKSDLLEDAKNRAMSLRPAERPLRVFILGELYDTNFIKDTPGGMLGSKQYFEIGRLGAEDAVSLAEELRNKFWSDFA